MHRISFNCNQFENISIHWNVSVSFEMMIPCVMFQDMPGIANDTCDNFDLILGEFSAFEDILIHWYVGVPFLMVVFDITFNDTTKIADDTIVEIDLNTIRDVPANCDLAADSTHRNLLAQTMTSTLPTKPSKHGKFHQLSMNL